MFNAKVTISGAQAWPAFWLSKGRAQSGSLNLNLLPLKKSADQWICHVVQDQQNNTENWTEPLTHDNFKATTDKYSIGD